MGATASGRRTLLVVSRARKLASVGISRARAKRSALALVVSGATGARIDRVAVEAQRGDEAPLGVVGLEHLDVGGVVDAFGGQGGDTATMDD
jgi:hypothetical protein